MSNINGNVYTTVTYGTGAYTTALTIGTSGTIRVETTVAAGITGDDGLDSTVAAAKITNEGSISAGNGGNGADGMYGGAGGIGVNLSGAATLNNFGDVRGGYGGSYGSPSSGFVLGMNGAGGVGVRFEGGAVATGTLKNGTSALIYGGRGRDGGYGGDGVDFGAKTLTNLGTIRGGIGSDGGAGVNVAGGTVTNTGSIYGGSGGYSFGIAGTTYQLKSGAGVILQSSADATLTNSSVIGGGSSDGQGATGGIGVQSIGQATLTNTGTIKGGSGSGSSSANYGPGNGGVGVSISGANDALTNKLGTITGGYGGSTSGTAQTAANGGDAVDVLGGASLATSGTITGGNSAPSFAAGVASGNGGAGVYITGAGSSGTQTNGSITGGQSGFDEFSSLAATGSGGAGVALNGGTFGSTGGSITGGAGAQAFESGFTAGTGGTGVSVTAGTLTDSGTSTITGGAGGVGSSGAAAGVGGAGATVTGGSLDISTTILGGVGGLGSGATSASGAGGAGAELSGGTTTQSAGSITGGKAGYTDATDAAAAGSGGVGVSLTGSATMSAAGSITGGAGGRAYGSSSVAGNGGAGVYVSGTLTTTGTITGGAGGDDTSGSGTAGSGGAGAVLAGGTLTTSSAIAGGAAGSNSGGATAGVAGDAVHFQSGDASTLVVEKGASFAGAISGFAIGDTVDIANYSLASGVVQADLSGATLTTSSDGTLSFTNISPADRFAFKADASGNGTDVYLTPVCYMRGTRLRTPRGEVPIEALSVGDTVIAVSGEARAIRWLGHRRFDCARHPNPAAVWPIRIGAGAFADGLPVRDLWVSPGHMLLVGDVLIQAGNLVNGATIQQIERARLEYWHVELDSHDIVYAEGLPAESYLDTGNRTNFVNGGDYLEAHPDFAPKHWSETCRPLIETGPMLHAAKAALIERARTLGYTQSEDSDTHIVAEGRRYEPIALGAQRLAFVLPASLAHIELRSGTFVPRHFAPENGDDRALGICIGRLQIDGTEVDLNETAATVASGWHALEREADKLWRWTRGATPLPAGSRLVVIDVVNRSFGWSAPVSATPAIGAQ